MKKSYLIVFSVLAVLICLNIRCAKINEDQPCGMYMNKNIQLFKSADSQCYYVDGSGNKVIVDKSNCTCF